MAYIYGNAAKSSTTRASARRKDILLRLALPLLFVLTLAGVALYAFRQEQYWLTGIFAIFFVASILRFEELGLTLSHHLSQSQTSARTGQVVARALEHLPNEYHVFHDLHFEGNRIDHAVIGPNGLFLISTSSHLGNISASGESLRLNGWPFLMDLLTGCWNRTQKLTIHLDLQYSGGLRPCPVLCFSRASVGIMGPVRGALVVEAGNLVQAILAYEDSLLSDRMFLLIDKISELVSVKTQNPLSTQDQAQTSLAQSQTIPAKPNLPVCTKCNHQATVLEFELFPGECPKCGRLYSFVPDESEATPEEPSKQSAWKPSLPQLAMTALLVAGGAGYLAYSQGLVEKWQSVTPVRTTAPSKAALPARTDAPPVPPASVTSAIGNASQAAAPSQPDTVAQQSVFKTNATDAEPAFQAAESSPPKESQAGAADNATLAASDDTLKDTPPTNASAPVAKVKATTTTTKSADPFDQGKLVVTSDRPVTLWFKNQQTFKEFGPFEIGSKKDILLPKGFYSVVYLENGKRRHTTMSFLSDHGQLDF